MPEFPGGTQALNAYMKENTRYPSNAVEARVQGTVLLEFVVEKDGSISNVRVVSSLFPSCDEEAIRVIKSLPKWKPGEAYGKKVRAFYNVPFTFTLQN